MLKKLYSPFAFDSLFVMVGMVSVVAIWFTVGHPAPLVAAAADPVRKGVAALAVLLVATVLAAMMNRLDQLLADDFVFDTLTKSAMIGIFAFVFALVGWELLFAANLGEFPSQTMLPLLTAGWSLGYLYTRLRGTRA